MATKSILLFSFLALASIVQSIDVLSKVEGQEICQINATSNGAQNVTIRFKRETRKKDKKFLSNCLDEHNKFRRRHQVAELKWDEKIAKFARKRANRIAKSDGKEFSHPPDLPYGENLAWHSSSGVACAKLVSSWYAEIDDYSFKRPQFASATGHFTQLVWKSTRRLGCASAVSPGRRGGVYLVCNYDPAGNFVGEFGDNVLRKKRKKRTKKKKKRPIRGSNVQ